MIATNRFLNRLIIAVAGFILLVVGLAGIGLSVLPEFRRAWASIAAPFMNWLNDQASATPLGDTRHSSLWIAVVAVCVLGIAFGLWFVLSRGRGRTTTALRRSSSDVGGVAGAGAVGGTDTRRGSGARRSAARGSAVPGSVVVDAAVAEQAIRSDLEDRHELLAVNVGAYRIRGQRALKVTAITRRGADPTRVASYIEEAVRGWDGVLGTELPVLIEITADIRSRIHSRVQSTARVAR